MTTTTGDTPSLKTPASLSGGDLVSRLLAATPPYLYNVPLTPHSFFFSEMLRSFVQAKAEASTSSASPPSAPRRRKRSWRDARERPLELTTKDKNHLHLHHHHHHQQQQQQQHKDKYFQAQMHHQQQQQQQSHQDAQAEGRFKSHSDPTAMSYSSDGKSNNSSSYEHKPSAFVGDQLKPSEDNCSDYRKDNRGFFDDSSRHLSDEQAAQREVVFSPVSQKVKPEEQQTDGERNNCNYAERNACDERPAMTNQELSFLADQKTKLDYAAVRNFLPAVSAVSAGGGAARAEELQQVAKGFGITGNVTNSDFLPAGPLWYPPYPSMAQPYPGIDPLHFFIDLRVSGHIWDRKLNERQLPFKSKHCSAFSVPQTKEYNRPLNLTRDEAATSSSSSSTLINGTKNLRGTNFILRNLTDTYKDIREMEKNSSANETSVSPKSPSLDDNGHKDCQARSWPKSETPRSSTSRDNQQQEETEGKDLRALIGLELVVDYVKEPKEDPAADEEPSSAIGE